MFYAGAPFIAKGYAFRNDGYDEALRSAESFLKSYEAPRGAASAKTEGGRL
jgi:4-hydroxyphenylacetate 3-monooxygenase